MTQTAVREEVREAILDAAERLFQRFGYKKTTVEDIAAEAGMSRGTIYLYFHGKEKIALSWAERYHKRLCAELRRLADLEPSVTEKLRQMLKARVLLRFDAMRQYANTIDEILVDLHVELLVRRDDCYEAEATLFTEILKQGDTTDPLVTAKAMSTARVLILATNGLLPHYLSPRMRLDRQVIQSSVEQLADLLLHGLSP